MNWLTNFVRPKIRALVSPSETPENLWTRCPNCDAMIFHRDLDANLHVCQQCDHHMRLPPEKRLVSLFDDGIYRTIDTPHPPADPLKFRDAKRYVDRLKEAQAKTGRHDAVLVGHGEIGGMPAVVAVFDFAFMGGSMGTAVGEAIVTASRLAVLQEAALVVVTASGGARMQEGILSLMQMPRTVIAVEQVKDAGLPYLVVFSDPTTGGVTASFAMLGDIQIAEPGARIAFAGARVIEETLRERLPEGFQRAEYLREHGMVDMVVHRKAMNKTVGDMLSILMQRSPSAELVPITPVPMAVEAGNQAAENVEPIRANPD